MQIFFADDSQQGKPTRRGMSRIVAVGGFMLPADNLKALEDGLNELCDATGLPLNEEFKWSPNKDSWMHASLVGADRESFYFAIIDLLAEQGARAMVVLEDCQYARAEWRAKSPEEDVVRLFLERADQRLADAGEVGLVVADQPPGGATNANKFLMECLDVIQEGTEFVRPSNIAINVVYTPSRYVRAIQAADLIVGSMCAHVAGESNYSTPVVARILPLLFRQGGVVGGRGVKIHPDTKYVNLYHWLFGDAHHNANRGMGYLPLPSLDRDFAEDANTP